MMCTQFGGQTRTFEEYDEVEYNLPSLLLEIVE